MENRKQSYLDFLVSSPLFTVIAVAMLFESFSPIHLCSNSRVTANGFSLFIDLVFMSDERFLIKR